MLKVDRLDGTIFRCVYAAPLLVVLEGRGNLCVLARPQWMFPDQALPQRPFQVELYIYNVGGNLIQEEIKGSDKPITPHQVWHRGYPSTQR